MPLAELGLVLRDGLRLKMDCGVLEGDSDGGMTVRRVYWSNKLPQTTADIPSEARVMPDTWGWIRFFSATKGPALGQPAGPHEGQDKNVRDLFNGLDGK